MVNTQLIFQRTFKGDDWVQPAEISAWKFACTFKVSNLKKISPLFCKIISQITYLYIWLISILAVQGKPHVSSDWRSWDLAVTPYPLFVLLNPCLGPPVCPWWDSPSLPFTGAVALSPDSWLCRCPHRAAGVWMVTLPSSSPHIQTLSCRVPIPSGCRSADEGINGLK